MNNGFRKSDFDFEGLVKDIEEVIKRVNKYLKNPIEIKPKTNKFSFERIKSFLSKKW